MSDFFDSIFNKDSVNNISIWMFLLCISVTLILGLFYYISYSISNRSTRSFKTALIYLPTAVCVVIMMVNGNIGIGLATAGTFSLIKFRSAQGTAKEISIIFMAMCTGLISGVGYLGFACIFTIIMSIIIILTNIFSQKMDKFDKAKVLKITIPEDLDFPTVFNSILDEYTLDYELLQVKTTTMGSLFKLTYNITLKKDVSEKEFIDKLRVRNGNLEISILRRTNEIEL